MLNIEPFKDTMKIQQDLELLKRLGAGSWRPNTRAQILNSTFIHFLRGGLEQGSSAEPKLKGNTNELSFEI